ncbi:MAG: WD40 repeat protein/serine/threonine protein kinase [Pseudohongiellaceae bacterium]|jgi:WD40 repeat protein/serine/threonine protein kinase
MPPPSDPESFQGRSAEELFEHFLDQYGERDEVAFERLCAEQLPHAEQLRRLRSLWLRFSGAVDDLGDFDKPGQDTPSPASAPRTQAVDIVRPGESLEQLVARLSEASSGGQHLGDRREIARGGMGRILRTWDNSLRRTLAMKVLLDTRLYGAHIPEDSSERRQLSRFLEEAQITGQLDHPGIVPVHELGVDDEGQVYFTMRLVRGRSLRTVFDLIRDGQEGWTVTRALGVLLKVCHAAAFAHSKGVIHRDLKPANIMVGRFGETYVMDWGLAKVVGREDTHDLRPNAAPETTNLSVVSTDRADLNQEHPTSPLLTMDGTVVGTPAYMSPEQAEGFSATVGPQADVYSVGAMLYQLLTGQKPYVASDEHLAPRQILERVLDGPPTPVVQLARATPPELVAICEKAMARKVADRYPDLSLMADELDAFLEGRVVQAYSTGAIAQLKKWVGRHRAVAALMVTVIAAITIALLFTLDLNADLTQRTEQLRLRERQLVTAVDEATAARQVAELQTAAKDDALASKDVALHDREAAVAFARRSRQLAERSRYVASLGAVDGALSNREVASAQRLLNEGLPELRGWEWQHLKLASNPAMVTTQAHKSSALAVAFSPVDSLVATVGLDGQLKLWDPSDGSPVVTLNDGDVGLSTVAFSPDGTMVAAAGWDDRILRWDLASGSLAEPLLLASDAEVSRGGAVTSLHYSPDGATLYAGTDLHQVLAFDCASGSRRVIRQLHTGPVTSLTVSNDGRLLASGSSDHSALIWDAARGEPLLHLFDHEAPLWAVAFSPTANSVATGSGDGRVSVFDRESGALLWRDNLHSDAVTCLAFSPDGEQLITGSSDRTLRISDAHDGRHLATLNGHRNAITSLAFDQLGGRCATVDVEGSLHIWDTQDRGARSTLSAHTDHVSAFVTSPHGRLAVTAALDGRMHLWDTEARLSIAVRELSHDGSTALALSPNGSTLASADGSSHRGHDHPITLWDVQDPTTPVQLPRTLNGHTQAVLALAFSPQNNFLASASRDRTVRIWESASGLLLQKLSGHRGQVLSLAFDPRGDRLVSGGFDESVRVWDISSGAELVNLQTVGSHVGALAFDSAGQVLAVGSGSGGLALHDPQTLQPMLSLVGHQGDISALTFHPSEPRLASAADDGTIRLWDTESGAELMVLRPGGKTRSLAFSHDGSRLFASAGPRVDVYESEGPASSWELRQQWAQRNAEAHELVGGLLDQHVDPRLAELALRDQANDGRMTPLLLADGLRIIGDFGSEPELLADAAWAVVSNDDANPSHCITALRQARAAQRMRPGRARFMSLLGMALYRVGDFAEASALFERAWSANVYDRDYPSSWDLYFAAMASAQLGRADDARAYLAQAQDVSASGLDDDHPATVTFAAEARQVLR